MCLQTVFIPEASPCTINGTKLAKVVRMDSVSSQWAKAMAELSDGDLLEDSSRSAYEEQTLMWDAFVEWCDGKCVAATNQ